MDAAQAAGMDPEICADKIVRAVEAERNEVYIGGKEKLGVYLQRFVPDLFALIIRKTKVKVKQFYQIALFSQPSLQIGES